MPNNPPKKPGVHTVPNPIGGWDNKQGGKVKSHADTKAEAQKLGRDQAVKDQTEHRIHNKDGKIGKSNSYGNDPNPPKDKNR
ncbi:DUF2188 domain-containing protein [Paenibacillus sp. CGMCC 1.16610]|uniref:DUF2188 domain-containing protein n=2 Tax=Paenibacillus TaxID=44249 RepID=A0ABW9TZS6_9BACL|nr:DUF2188 domain-containing protein [Paenibacillus sp. CGMCC 1.16610]MVQ33342.1 DUF2188 domain-containing protein [Paenibacillus anseongense]